MNLTDKGKFQTGNTLAKHKAGRKHKKTIVKEKLGLSNLQDLEQDLISGWNELLHSKSKTDKRFALKEISKYVFCLKKEVTTINFNRDEAKKAIEDMFLK